MSFVLLFEKIYSTQRNKSTEKSYRVDFNLVNCIIVIVKLLDVTDSEHCSLLMITDFLHFPLQRRVMP